MCECVCINICVSVSVCAKPNKSNSSSLIQSVTKASYKLVPAVTE